MTTAGVMVWLVAPALSLSKGLWPARSEGVRPAAEAVVAGVLRSLRQPPADPRQSLLALRILRV